MRKSFGGLALSKNDIDVVSQKSGPENGKVSPRIVGTVVIFKGWGNFEILMEKEVQTHECCSAVMVMFESITNDITESDSSEKQRNVSPLAATFSSRLFRERAEDRKGWVLNASLS